MSGGGALSARYFLIVPAGIFTMRASAVGPMLRAVMAA
jgi:hypothetical protein